MCVCIRISSAACVSRRHTPRSPGHGNSPTGPRNSGSLIVDRLPTLKSQCGIVKITSFSKGINLAIALIFFRIDSFPVMKEFDLSRSFKAFVLEVSKANRQLQQTGVRCWSDEACLRGWANWSRGVFHCFFLSHDPERAMPFVFIKVLFLCRATSPEPPIAEKGWEGGVDSTGRRNQLLNRLPQVLIEHYEKKPAYGGSPLCDRMFRETRNQGVLLPERRVKFLEMNNFETANSQVSPPPPPRHWWSESKLRRGRPRRSLRRWNTWKLTVA